jgi:membrane protease YdiL (CAAX protease family)
VSQIVSWTRRHRIAAFFGLTFLFTWWSWPLWALGLAPWAHWPIGPLLAALVVIGVTDGTAGYRTLWQRMLHWRIGWRLWLFTLGVPFVVLALASLANATLFGAPAPALAGMAWGAIALNFALRFVDPLDGPLGEEPGWRGYALPLLQVRRSPLAAASLLGVAAATWHVPLVVTGQLAPVGIPVTFAITFVYVWLVNRTGGSLLAPMVFHVAQGTVSLAALGFTGLDAVRMDWLTGGLWVLLAAGLVLGDRAAWRSAGQGAVAARTREPLPA